MRPPRTPQQQAAYVEARRLAGLQDMVRYELDGPPELRGPPPLPAFPLLDEFAPRDEGFFARRRRRRREWEAFLKAHAYASRQQMLYDLYFYLGARLRTALLEAGL